MLEINNLNIKIQDRFLIKNLSLVLNPKDHLAIIGEEGNGKSTLLKSILGICEYADISGTINLNDNHIGYLPQTITPKNEDLTVREYLFTDSNDYYDKIGDFYKYLDTFDLKSDILDRKFATLSGGEKVKIGILSLLLEDDDILFLDEPTNDLDIQTLEWLEAFISSSPKPIMYVSHDETLLSKTANMILHLEQIKKKTESRHTLMRIDYDTYVENRLHSIERQTQISKSESREFVKKQDKLKRIMQTVEYRQNTISRQDPFGAAALKKKMHSLKSQEKRLDETRLTELPDVEESINFFFDEVSIPKGKTILELDLPELKVDDKVLSRDIKLTVKGNAHICIIGQNGVGKTTLIRYIYDYLKNRTDIKVGYMPQNYEDTLSQFDRVLDFIASSNKEETAIACTRLSSMKFTRDEILGRIDDLSNGTKAKLFLMKLVLSKSNVLILDEPTRNVSPLSNPIIRRVLRDFKGTIISISHDRKYLEEVADEIYLLTQDGLIKQ